MVRVGMSTFQVVMALLAWVSRRMPNRLSTMKPPMSTTATR